MDAQVILSEADQKVADLMLMESTEEECDQEAVAAESYQTKVRVFLYRLNCALSNLSQPACQVSGQVEVGSQGSSFILGDKKKAFRLPKIELKKFGGDLRDWLGWWSQFKKIDEEEEVHVSDKFNYLVQYMDKGSRAQELVNSYPQSDENYPKVISALKERFGKPKLLKQVYVRELLRMIMSKDHEKMSLCSLYDKLESHLRSLESLGVTGDQMAEFLFPMVESSLPEDILVAWQRSSLFGKDGSLENPPKSDLDYLMSFLKMEIDSEEQRVLARAGFNSSGRKKKLCQVQDQIDVPPTAAGLFNGQGQSSRPSCIFCEKHHESTKCHKAKSMSLEERLEKVTSKWACFSCLKTGHMSKSCRNPIKCSSCGKKHPVLVCNEGSKLNPQTAKVENVHSNLNCTNEVLLQTLKLFLRNPVNRKQKEIRVLIDSGSQRSYVLKSTLFSLGFQSTQEFSLNHLLFGGQQKIVQHNKYVVELRSSLGKSHSTRISVLDQERICGRVPRASNGAWVRKLKLEGIQLSDFGAGCPEVEMLIGADQCGQILTGSIIQLENGLTALETSFGWTVMGESHHCEPALAMSVISMHVSSSRVEELWDLETIGIRDPVESKSQLERDLAVKEHFRRTVTRKPDGRYSVSLPWVNQSKLIPTNRTVAEKRLVSATDKLLKLNLFNEYDNVFEDWVKEGIISLVEGSVSDGGHYLPHRAVVKPESQTTPIRPVYDASCKVGRSPSLNSSLEKGPNLMELIPSVLLRFREGLVGVTSDVRKAFLMIEVNEEDRDFLKFLWWQDRVKNTFKVFKHNRVVFGLSCSPFLLGAVIEYHLSQVGPELRETATKLMRSMYVDNCVTSVNSHQEYKEFKDNSTTMMAEAQMDLRQWECTLREDPRVGQHSWCGLGARELCTSNPVSSVLGLKWNRVEDSIWCEVNKSILPEKITKRTVLSEVQRIFDPLGFLSPTLLLPKLLLQKAWSLKSSWDDELPLEMKDEFQEWWSDSRGSFPQVRVPRNVTGGGIDRSKFQLHSFCDASKYAYAAVVFLRVELENGVSVQLLQSKARVAPLKKSTIPRLELLGCSILSRLTTSVRESMGMKEIPVTFWSDSTTALSWIKRNNDWGTFVGNRVKEICTLTDPSSWRHVPGIQNPADLPSRGCSAVKLLESNWWEGPDWLKLDSSHWPAREYEVDEDAVSTEVKLTTTTMINQVQGQGSWYVTKSSYSKNVRIIAFVLRFVDKIRKKQSESQLITRDEFKRAETLIFKLIQEDSFPQKSQFISGLRVEKDENGLLRVKTKLVHRKDSVNFRFPVLLPNEHELVTQLILETHKFNCHGGAQVLMSILREKVWIIQGRKAVRRILNSCVSCRRFSSKALSAPTTALPMDRVKEATTFEVTGVDLAGPLILKDGSKSYIVLFTCGVFRCVHLEAVQSLSTEDFLLAFTRFSRRRRRPSIIYSDNGTNFVGASNLFKMLDWKRIEKETQTHPITWKFNPPSAPWWGGFWERLVRSVKDLLKRMLGSRRLNFVQLETVLCEVEDVINSRPLTYVTEDQDDLIPLTPSMFLHHMPTTDQPESELLEVGTLQDKYRNLKKLSMELRSRFRKEYLGQLVQRGKSTDHRQIKIGDVVLVGMDNKKRVLWPMARVIEIMPGQDGSIRVVKVRIPTGDLIRPIQRIYPLEVSSDSPILQLKGKHVGGQQPKKNRAVEPEVKATVREQVLRTGRKVHVPVKYGP